MSLPFGNRDTTFEQLLQELPPDYRELAIEFRAFARSRKIKTPEQLLRVVMNDCGLDAVLRETAGTFTLLEERISDTAIHRRWKACGPWVKALLSRMMDAAVQPLAEGHLRFLVIDASTVQSPGATGTDYRIHRAINWVRLHLVEVKVTNAHTGEPLSHYVLQDGDGVVADRGYNQVTMWMDQADRGVGLVVRYNPHGIPLHDPEGNPLDLESVLSASGATECCLPTQVRNRDHESLAGHRHALRLPPAQAAEARRRGAGERREKRPSASGPDPNLCRMGADLDHAAARDRVDGYNHGALSGALANRTGLQAIEKHLEHGSPPGQERQPLGRGLSPRQVALCLDRRETALPALWSRLASAGSAPPRHPLANLDPVTTGADHRDSRRPALECEALAGSPRRPPGASPPPDPANRTGTDYSTHRRMPSTGMQQYLRVSA
ncbi:hypothetical protein BN874_2510001 [Candidatus Contendobacter odensis Run_B_J11]|uniref:Transposase IS4-like domain-containing protein n=1 Tax=Candidatus Contendobacter odensis Run_B_J11 TaxID=1400861 RepID=A0A7U7GBT0_9GAMM|nr:hypothetical protein [Candidatus Contendobacter odensis]CDH45518.1 hypothetical protein BN874_2510001 [Candidatus Contendobacter odensis Run_B_J11]